MSYNLCVAVGLTCGNEKEVQKVLSMIDEIRGPGGKKYYSNEYFKTVEQYLEKVEDEQIGGKSQSDKRDITRRVITDEKSFGTKVLELLGPILQVIASAALKYILGLFGK